MLLKERIPVIRPVITLILAFFSAGLGEATANEARALRTSALKDLITSLEGTPKEPVQIFKTREGYLRFIGAPPSTRFAVTAGTPEQSADAFLERWRSLFVNESPAVGFDVKRIKSSDGRSYVRYRQIFSGLEVFGAEVIVQVNATGGIVAVISDIMRDTSVLDTKKVSPEPAIDTLTAQKKGIEFLAEQHKKLKFEASAPALMIYAPEVVGNSGKLRLAVTARDAHRANCRRELRSL